MKRALIVLASVLTVAAPAMADEALAKAKNCLACHQVDKKVVGPSYKEVAKKHGNDAKKADMLADKIMKGGSGVYGAVPMPANPQVSKDEATKLATWILGLK
jgi:cytochrome c